MTIRTAFAYRQWRRAERELVDAISLDREEGVTWKTIAKEFGHGRPDAASRWHARKLRENTPTHSPPTQAPPPT